FGRTPPCPQSVKWDVELPGCGRSASGRPRSRIAQSLRAWSVDPCGKDCASVPDQNASARQSANDSSSANDGGHFVFLRCWPLFTTRFPFSDFDNVVDADLLDALKKVVVAEQFSTRSFRRLVNGRHDSSTADERYRQALPDLFAQRRQQ